MSNRSPTRLLASAASAILVLFLLSPEAIADAPASDLDRLVDELSSADFAVRQRASADLKRAGIDALPQLLSAANSSDSEVRSRVLGILLAHSRARPADVRQGARAALRDLAQSPKPSVAKAAAETLRKAQESTAGAAAAELTRLGATLGPAQAGQSLTYNVQIRQSWTGGDDRLSLLSDLGEVPWLSLENSPVSDSALPHISKLGASPNGLTKLYLGNSRITGAGLPYLSSLSRLQYLSLKQLPIDNASLARLPDFPDLQYLGLDGTRVGDDGLKALARFPQLQVLWLDHTPITDAGLAHLRLLASLRTLYLPNTQLTGVGLAHLRNLPNLSSLSLKGTKLNAGGMKHVGQLEQLESLGLDMTGINDDQLADIASLTRLRILWLSGTPIGDAGLEHLKNLKALQIIHLSDTQVTREGAADLQRALPTCQITAVNQFKPASAARGNPALPARPPLPTIP